MPYFRSYCSKDEYNKTFVKMKLEDYQHGYLWLLRDLLSSTDHILGV